MVTVSISNVDYHYTILYVFVNAYLCVYADFSTSVNVRICIFRYIIQFGLDS